MASDPVVWRLERVERRVESIDEHGTREIAVQRVKLSGLKEDVEQLRDEVKRLRNSLYVAAGSIIAGAVLFALTVLQIQ